MSTKKRLFFQTLEPRHLLSASNLISNGAFESGFGFEGLEESAEVDSWEAPPNESGQRIVDVRESVDGNKLNLNARPFAVDRVFQDVPTVLGQKYLLTFDFVSNGVNSSPAKMLRVYWDGSFAAAFQGSSWHQSYAVELVGTGSPETRLEFRDSLSNESLTLIDNISLTPIADGSLQNGDFESVEPGKGQTTHVSRIDGWVTDGHVNERKLEIRKKSKSSNADDRYIHLDSKERYDRFFQSVSVESGSEYMVVFDMRSPLDSTDKGNQLRVRWSGKHAATFVPTTSWQTYSVKVSALETGESFLDFREAVNSKSNLGDGVGPWIDNVRFFETSRAFSITTADPGGDVHYGTFTGDELDVDVFDANFQINAEQGATITSARISIANAHDELDELLMAVVDGTSVVAEYDALASTLYLSGHDSLENYNRVFRSVKYTNLSLAPNTLERTIEISISKLATRFGPQQFGGFSTQSRSQPMETSFASTIVRIEPGVDTDADGITDIAEARFFGTNPNVFDTDGDFLPDGVEIRTAGVDPLVVDDRDADLDGDSLTNLDEVIHGSRLDQADSDRDGVSDGQELDQGSNPMDISDAGVFDTANSVELELVVGDHSGSHSERYNLIVGKIRHQAQQFGVVSRSNYKFKQGTEHEISIVHTGTKLASPDFDYTARIIANNGAEIQIEDPHGILGVHNESSYFFAEGKTATLIVVGCFEVAEGQLTFDAEGHEGGKYHSRKPHVPSNNSGLTIGRGYDLKFRSGESVIADLVAAGMDRADAELYSGAAGLKGQAARDFMAKNNLKEITPEQQKQLFEGEYSRLKRDVMRISNKADVVKMYGKTDFSTIDPKIVEMLVDLRYRGDYTPSSRQLLQKHVANNDLEKFREVITDRSNWTNVPRDRFDRRVEFFQNN